MYTTQYTTTLYIDCLLHTIYIVKIGKIPSIFQKLNITLASKIIKYYVGRLNKRIKTKVTDVQCYWLNHYYL